MERGGEGGEKRSGEGERRGSTSQVTGQDARQVGPSQREVGERVLEVIEHAPLAPATTAGQTQNLQAMVDKRQSCGE